MNQIAFDRQLPLRLKRQLHARATLPQATLSPELSYGRHRGPNPVGSRVAAVAVAMYFDAVDKGWTIPLTLRPRSLSHHAGQICLPGGRVEQDEDLFAAALREFEEELGTVPDVIEVCGQLSTQYVYASDNVVHPWVAEIHRPTERWRPDPIEVEQVIELPLSALLDHNNRIATTRRRSVRVGNQEVGSLTFRATAIQYDHNEIWGATALILDQLAQMLRQLDSADQDWQIDSYP